MRVLIVTDRDELDKQIEGVMKNAGVVGPDSPSPESPTAPISWPSSAPTRPGCSAP